MNCENCPHRNNGCEIKYFGGYPYCKAELMYETFSTDNATETTMEETT